MTAAPVSFGFLRPSPHRIVADEPEITYAAGTPVVNGRAADWDYSAPIRVEWTFAADLDGVRHDCHLDAESRIDAVVSWHSTLTNLRGAGAAIPVANRENYIALEIPGELLGGFLTLTLSVTLGTGSNAQLPAPRRPGSLLWSTRRTVTLEGAAARLPIMAVDFAASGYGRANGMWLLECDHDLTTSAAGALILYLNTAHPEMKQLLDRPADSESKSLSRFIAYDITRQLIVRALQDEGLDERHDYESGTVGDMLLTVIRGHLPGRELEQLRREYHDDPGQIDAEVLANAWTPAR